MGTNNTKCERGRRGKFEEKEEEAEEIQMKEILLDEESSSDDIWRVCEFFESFYEDLAYRLDEGDDIDPEKYLKLTTEILPKIFAFWQKHKDDKGGSVYTRVALSTMCNLTRIPVPDHGCSLFINTVNFCCFVFGTNIQ